MPTRSLHSVESVLSSVRSVMVTGSTEVLVIFRVKVKTPPGSGSVSGSADFTRVTVGSTSVTVTVASSLSVAEFPSLSRTVTSAVFG